MRILITAYGSGGDVHPLLGVGKALGDLGHHVSCLVNPHFRPSVERIGAEFLPLDTEEGFLELARSPELSHRIRGPLRYLKKLIDLAPETIQGLRSAFDTFRPDLVLRYHMSFGARWACQEAKIPCSVAVVTPGQWFSANDRGVSPHPWISRAQTLAFRVAIPAARPIFHLIAGRGLLRVADQFGFPREANLHRREMQEGLINLGLWSPSFRPPRSDDPKNGVTCGFSFFDQPLQSDQLCPVLTDFLNDGPPPIVFSMGTAVVHSLQSFFDTARAVTKDLGQRSILLQGGNRGPVRDGNVLSTGYAPLSQVLPRSLAAVHHAGIGSTAQAMRAGLPMLLLPVGFDQPDVAARARRLGVAQVIPFSRVSRPRLTEALGSLLLDDTTRLRAAELAKPMQREKGAQNAAEKLVSAACR